MLFLSLVVFTYFCNAQDFPKGLYETSGFHCYSRDSMRLPSSLHGHPQSADPPFDLSIFDDETGRKIKTYKPNHIYRVKLEAYVHFRGLMLQPRLCTSHGQLIGSLRGGQFIEDFLFEANGIGFHQCGRLITNDSLTHRNDDKKFLAEARWRTNRDIGNVQFVATIATENQLYWERWRPRSAFLMGPSSTEPVDEKMFGLEKVAEKEVKMEKVKPSHHPLFEEQREFLKEKNVNISEDSDDVFDVDEEKVFGLRGIAEGSGEVGEMMEAETKSSMFTSKFTENNAQVTAFMANRMFKKFAPLNDTLLMEDDLRFLNNHNVQHDFVGDDDDDDCMDHECQNNSTCLPNKSGNYTCECSEGFVGRFCDKLCDKDFCKNDGKCYLKEKSGQFACKCVAGTVGRRCEKEINECSWKKCQNGAKCRDLLNDYACDCPDGWMGRHCDRPCRDIYGSCRIWRREGQCDFMRQQTDFFDVNCAQSCGQCRSNLTLEEAEKLVEQGNYLPLQPILMPFSWLLGEWVAYVKGWNNHTTDYPIDMPGMAYNETLTMSVAPSLMFGTPYLNYTAVMTSEDDVDDIHTYNGFITIQQYKKEEETKGDKGALSTVSNTGLVMIEEGEIVNDDEKRKNGEKMFVLTPSYVFYRDEAVVKRPDKMKRWFTLRNNRLVQYMVREFKGRTHKFTKIYEKRKEFQFL